MRLVEKKSCSLISRQEDIGPDPIVNQTDIYLHEMFERGTFCATNRVGLLRQPTKERNEKDRGGVEWRKEDTKERRWNYLHLCPGCRRGRRVYKSGTIGFGAIDFVIYDIQASEKDWQSPEELRFNRFHVRSNFSKPCYFFLLFFKERDQEFRADFPSHEEKIRIFWETIEKKKTKSSNCRLVIDVQI